MDQHHYWDYQKRKRATQKNFSNCISWNRNMEITFSFLLKSYPATLSQKRSDHSIQIGGLLQNLKWAWQHSRRRIRKANEAPHQTDGRSQGKCKVFDNSWKAVQEPIFLGRISCNSIGHPFPNEWSEDGMDNFPQLQKFLKDAVTDFAHHWLDRRQSSVKHTDI